MTAIDKDLSPYLKTQIAQIEQQIENGDADAAEALFTEADKYLPDPDVSTALQQRIQALREGKSQPDPVTDREDTLVNADEADTSQRVANGSGLDSAAGVASAVPPITNGISRVNGNPFPNTEIPARAEETTDAVDITETDTDNTDAGVDETSAVQTDTVSPNAVNPDTINNGSSTGSSTPLSAPRRSFVDGRGESAQHLNRLRTAIEAKNINRVLQISNDLPKERVDFLKQMFRRYDRLDVVIDRISDQSGELTAKLNVSMFNQRNDGSFYSAGRWNGVTVRSAKVDEQWQKIEW